MLGLFGYLKTLTKVQLIILGHFTAPNFHWYKDDEELFIRHNLTIEATPDGSQLTILRADPTDGGTYTCTAVNTVGKFL